MRYVIFIFLFRILASCNNGQIEELQYELETLQTENDDLQSELDDCNYELEEAQQKISNLEEYANNLGDELSSLKSEIDDFWWEDWQVNVYDVESKFRNVENAFEELEAEF